MSQNPVLPNIHVRPLALRGAQRLDFVRSTVVPGVHVQPYKGRISEFVTKQRSSLPTRESSFKPSHLLVVDEDGYFKKLDARLHSEGHVYPQVHSPLHQAMVRHPIDFEGIIRQTLISLTLLAGVGWTFTGSYSFRADRKNVVPTGHFGHAGASTSYVIESSMVSRFGRHVTGSRLRAIAIKLDRYYRSGIWWSDRLGVALGYLWASLTTPHGELAFAGMTMALEALLSTSHVEISHTLAERCAIIRRQLGSKPEDTYREVKEIYALRSKIVHGAAAPKRGTLTAASLFVNAKRSNLPVQDLSRICALTLDTIKAVLQWKPLLAILSQRQSATKENERLAEFFTTRLLRA